MKNFLIQFLYKEYIMNTITLNKNSTILILFILSFLVFLPSSGYAQEEGTPGKGDNTFGMEIALMFFLPELIDIDTYSDGVQTGAGMKMWFTRSFAIRALVHLYRQTNEELETSVTEFGVSGAAEYHFSEKRLSPYAGGLIGVLIEAATGVETENTLYIGGLFGVELELYRSISLFGEYDLLLRNQQEGYTLSFGTVPEGLIGILIYF
jgi:hypothetical protein